VTMTSVTFPGPPEVGTQVFARFGPNAFPTHYYVFAVALPHHGSGLFGRQKKWTISVVLGSCAFPNGASVSHEAAIKAGTPTTFGFNQAEAIFFKNKL